MFLKLLGLFTIVPIVELFILIEIGRRIGTLPTIGIIVLTGALGAYLTKAQGLTALRQIREAGMAARLPGDELLHGVMVLLGGALLLTPGIITDFVGFSLLFPPTRRIYVRKVKERFKRRMLRTRGIIESELNFGKDHPPTGEDREDRNA